MKTYLKTIQIAQKSLLVISILIMLILPLLIVFKPDWFSDNVTLRLYDISHITVLLVMIIRPLADIFKKTKTIRPFVILRKGVGVLSASIVVSFIFSKIMINAAGYFGAFMTSNYWSFHNFAILAHLADISAVLLLITSNSLSKKLLGTGWKKIQRLSYVYFYASSFYVFLVFANKAVAISIILVTILTLLAHFKNEKFKEEIQIKPI